MKLLKTEQFLPVTIEQVWDFFATPANLNAITPKDMIFEITSDVPDKMYEGMIITYKIRPFLNIPFQWCTEITHIRVNEYFIDEQRIGPYRLWHHEHHFKSTENGVIMTDILHYDIGKAIFGRIAGFLYIDKRVKDIFNYRKQTLDKLFTK